MGRFHRRPMLALAVAFAFMVAVPATMLLLSSRVRPARAAGATALEIRQPIVIRSLPPITLEKGVLKGDTSQFVGAMAAQVVGKGPKIGALTLERPVISVDLAAPINSAWSSKTTSLMLNSLTNGDFGSLALSGGTVRILGEDGRPETLSEVALVMNSLGAGAVAFNGAANWRGKAIAISGTLRNQPVADGKGQPRLHLKLDIKGQPFGLTFDGHLTHSQGYGLVGAVDVKIADLGATARWLGLAFTPESGPGATRLKGNLRWIGGAIALEKLEVDIDGHLGRGVVTIEPSPERPQIEGTLAFKTMSLPGSLAGALPIPRASASRGLPPIGRWPTFVPILRSLDADMRISTDRLLLAGSEFGRGAVALSVRRSRLLADIAELELDGGRASGQVTIDMSSDVPRYSMRVKSTGLDASRSMARLLGSGWLNGKVDAWVDVSGIGNTMGELFEDLSGRMRLSMPAGGRFGADMRALMTAPALPGGKANVTAFKGSTSFAGAEIEAFVWRGTAELQRAKVSMGDALVLDVTGSANLAARSLALRLRPDQDAAGPTSPVRAPRSMPERSVVIGGPWAAPTVTDANPAQGQ